MRPRRARRAARGSVPLGEPLGATVAADGTRVSRLGPARARGRGAKRRERRRARGGRARRLRGHRAALAPADDYVVRASTGAAVPDPCSRCQPRGPARALARARPGRAPSVHRRPWPHPARGARHLRAARRHVHARGHVRRRHRAPRASWPSWAITAIEIMPVAEFPGDRGWGYDGVYISCRPIVLRRPGGARAARRRGPRAGLAVILDVVYNHSAPPASTRSTAFGPYFTGSTRRRGAGRSTTTTPTATRSASGSCRAPSGWIARLRGRRPPARRDPRDLRLERRAHRRRHRPARPRSRPAGARDRRERPQRSARDARPRPRGGWGCDAAWADDFHHALHALLTGDRDGYYADFGTRRRAGQGLHRPHVYDGDYSPFRRRRFGAPAPTTSRRSASWCSPRTTTRSATAPSATGCAPGCVRSPRSARCSRRSCRCCSWARSTASTAPFQFFSDHIDDEIAQATREGRRAEFAAFAAVRRGDSRPAGPGDLRALEARRAA